MNHFEESQSKANISRRAALKGITGLGASALLAGCSHSVFDADEDVENGPVDLVSDENAKSGTEDWLLENPQTSPRSRHRCPWIEGYCSHTSIPAGEKLQFFVSSRPTAVPIQIEIFRMGYYGGAGARPLLTLNSLTAEPQPTPPVGKRRLRECRWKPIAELVIPLDWLSGIYLGRLTAVHNSVQSFVVFIVRDTRRADFIFQCSDITWQAYNKWPKHFSLYDHWTKRDYWGPDVEASLDRPYSKHILLSQNPQSLGSGEWLLWEFPLAYWMEAQGYDVTYISGIDTHSDARGLLRAKGFLSVGHDEYYTLEMYQNLQRAIRSGLNVAFLSGNTCCGRIQLRSNSEGRPHRIIRRIDRFGPKSETEIRNFPNRRFFPWSSPNENLLVGARSIPPMVGCGDWICSKPEHWLFEGTAMQPGEGIPNLVGFEWHGDPASIPGLEIISEGPTQSVRGPGHYTATIYPGPKGNFVFNASTCWWASALAEPLGFTRPAYGCFLAPEPDSRVQRITANLLNRMRQPSTRQMPRFGSDRSADQ